MTSDHVRTKCPGSTGTWSATTKPPLTGTESVRITKAQFSTSPKGCGSESKLNFHQSHIIPSFLSLVTLLLVWEPGVWFQGCSWKHRKTRVSSRLLGSEGLMLTRRGENSGRAGMGGGLRKGTASWKTCPPIICGTEVAEVSPRRGGLWREVALFPATASLEGDNPQENVAAQGM